MTNSDKQVCASLKEATAYKEALEALNADYESPEVHSLEFMDERSQTIRKALRLADALTQEISFDVGYAGAMAIMPNYRDVSTGEISEVFKVMINQLIKEIEDE